MVMVVVIVGCIFMWRSFGGYEDGIGVMVGVRFGGGGSDGSDGRGESVEGGFVEREDAKRGISIVAACKNRHEVLGRVLKSWLKVKGVDEVVIVDWDSEPGLRGVVFGESGKGNGSVVDGRVVLVRVRDEKHWVLTRAYNLAMNLTRFDKVIRLDCDYEVGEDFVEKIVVGGDLDGVLEGAFYTGDWKMARNENENHLNGAVFIKRDNFWKVGGYDERIQTYGFDDEDLYARLVANGVKRLNISYDAISHVHHTDEHRLQEGVKFPMVEISLNAILLSKLDQWNSKQVTDGHTSVYQDISGGAKDVLELRAANIPPPAQEVTSHKESESAWAEALGHRLYSAYHVPWDVIRHMPPVVREKLLQNMDKLQTRLDHISNEDTTSLKISPPKNARLLIIHVQHGLGNRMRALASGLSFAQNTLREPLVVWEVDSHISARFQNLFIPGALVVLDKLDLPWPMTESRNRDVAWNNFRFYNYMDMEGHGAVKGEIIKNEPDKHLYYKGAYILESPEFTWWEIDNKNLLALEPIEEIDFELKSFERNNGNLSSMVGVHVRNRTLSMDINGVDFKTEYGEDAAASMETWRQKSNVYVFIKEMKRIAESENGKTNFYVATDTRQLFSVIETQFMHRTFYTERACDDRSADCVKYALIDMYAVAKTRKILGSNWSSFTEIVQRLSGKTALLAGQDFGNGAEEKRGSSDNVVKSDEVNGSPNPAPSPAAKEEGTKVQSGKIEKEKVKVADEEKQKGVLGFLNIF